MFVGTSTICALERNGVRRRGSIRFVLNRFMTPSPSLELDKNMYRGITFVQAIADQVQR
jgi:hypothetical protein